jgi:hypothetical protein
MVDIYIWCLFAPTSLLLFCHDNRLFWCIQQGLGNICNMLRQQIYIHYIDDILNSECTTFNFHSKNKVRHSDLRNWKNYWNFPQRDILTYRIWNFFLSPKIISELQVEKITDIHSNIGKSEWRHQKFNFDHFDIHNSERRFGKFLLDHSELFFRN